MDAGAPWASPPLSRRPEPAKLANRQRDGSLVAGGFAPAKLDLVVALIAAALIGADVRLPYNMPASVIVGFVLAPIAFPAARRYRGSIVIAGLVVLTITWGVLVAAFALNSPSVSLAVSQCLRVLSLMLALPVLLWACEHAGIARTILAFAIGMLLSVPLSGLHQLNPWKFDLGLPSTLIALSLPFIYRRRIPQVLIGCALIALNIAFSSRSAAGFLLIAVALAFTSSADATVSNHGRGWVALRYAQFAAVVAGAYFLLQGALLEGMLGEGIQERTQAQIDAGGSLLAGGRPEMGASAALIAANPWGYGVGALPTPAQILTAKGGMAALGYDPNNGYVEQYMFGTSFELHSTLGDLWVTFGLPGAVLAVLCIALLLTGTGSAITTGSLSTVAVYLVIRAGWDMAFSPIYSSILLLPLALAAVAVPRPSREVVAENSEPRKVGRT